MNAVDVLNVISLCSGLPISLLATERVGQRPMARYGRPGEQFVFNRSGQALDIEGLLCVCNGDGPDSVPLGTPVKDSMAGKVTDSDRDVWGVIYAPAREVDAGELEQWCLRLAEGFRDGCSAGGTSVSTFAAEIG
jgi:DNA/RNA-binding domain of Phe-tRNA-synthetase-like protein